MSDNLEPRRWASWFITAGRIFAVGCFVVAGYLALFDSPTSEKAPAESLSLSETSRGKQTRSHTTRPIETIRVGDRVLATNPEVSDSERTGWTEPEWESWLHLTLEINLPEMGASGTALVTEIHPRPTVKRSDGQVVTATFAHPPSREVLDVTFEGESALCANMSETTLSFSK